MLEHKKLGIFSTFVLSKNETFTGHDFLFCEKIMLF